jgi:hypothetical protein
MVGGEFSPNVGKSPNHNTNSFLIADARVFNYGYADAMTIVLSFHLCLESFLINLK